MKNFYKRFKKIYFAGPDWVIIPKFIRQSNYRSPTVMGILWLYAWHLRIFTIPGRIIIPVEFLVISYSFLLLQNQIKILAFGLLSIIISDFFIGFLFRPKNITVKRFLPERAYSGQKFEILYEVKNEGKFPVWNLTIDPMPFFSFKGENFWIPTIPCLMPGEEKKINTFRTAQKRGVFEIYRPIVETTFPFSIFKWSKQTGKGEKIVIRPDFESISELSIIPGQNYHIEGNTQISKTGDSTDFIGCREFRNGDNPRHIHWPSSARRGEFVVKEFQEEQFTRIALIIDRFLPEPQKTFHIFSKSAILREKKLEALVKLSTAILEKISNSEYLLDIFISGREVYHLEGSRTKRKYDYLMDIIACIKPDTIEPVSQLPTYLLEILSSIESVILIILNFDKSRLNLIRQLQERGINLKVILLYNEEEKISTNLFHLSVSSILNNEIKQL